MTISSEVRKAGPYAGNGVTVDFPFLFKVFATTDVEVVLAVVATGIETTLTSGYTVTLNADQNANPGGSVNYNPGGSPITSATTLTIGSVVTNTQGTHLISGGAWVPKNVEDMVDRVTILVQQLLEITSRSLRTSFSDPAPPDDLPPAAQRANLVLGFDATGAWKLYTPSVSLLDINPEIVIATAGQITINCSTYVPGSGNLSVYRNGIRQEGGGADYTEVSAIRYDFTEALSVGDKITSIISTVG